MSLSENLARQALENLVRQFARPMEFLRELVQNAIDAGTPRVEIWLRYQAAEQLLEIHVDDHGEGMDERIIDQQLTRMFSSTKEDDLTKIGKFGIGFTSVFAIEPEAVQVLTGRHGEHWELIFHPDRSFDKLRWQQPVAGTRITVYKRLPPSQVEEFVQECRWILEYWCKHSDTPIEFWDRTGHEPAAPASSEDPFGAFAEPVRAPAGPQRINQDLGLQADLQLRHESKGVVVVAGYGDSPSYGFYNGGLTLIETANADALGSFGEQLGHLRFKVKFDALEHTLTRDNVLQDQNWSRALEVVEEGAARLRQALLEKLEAEASAGADLAVWHRHLATECSWTGMHREEPAFARRVQLRCVSGHQVSLAQVEAQEEELGAVLLDCAAGPVRQALLADECILLPDQPALRALLEASYRPSPFPFLRKARSVQPADALFTIPQLVPVESLPARERVLLRGAGELLAEVVGERLLLRVGEFGGDRRAVDEALAMEGPPEGGLFLRNEPGALRWPLFLKRRCLLLNRHHPVYRSCAVACAEDPLLGAFGLAQLLLRRAGLGREGLERKLFENAASMLEEGQQLGASP